MAFSISKSLLVVVLAGAPFQAFAQNQDNGSAKSQPVPESYKAIPAPAGQGLVPEGEFPPIDFEPVKAPEWLNGKNPALQPVAPSSGGKGKGKSTEPVASPQGVPPTYAPKGAAKIPVEKIGPAADPAIEGKKPAGDPYGRENTAKDRVPEKIEPPVQKKAVNPLPTYAPANTAIIPRDEKAVGAGKKQGKKKLDYVPLPRTGTRPWRPGARPGYAQWPSQYGYAPQRRGYWPQYYPRPYQGYPQWRGYRPRQVPQGYAPYYPAPYYSMPGYPANRPWPPQYNAIRPRR